MGVAKSLSVHYVVSAQTNLGNKLQHPQSQCELALLDNPGSLVCEPKLNVVAFELGDMTVWL